MARRGFTLIELVVVLAIVALLAAIAAPRYFKSVNTAEEKVLRENLMLTRDALDKFYSDNARYPASLDELVGKRYLRALPEDPVTRSTTTWILMPPPDSRDGGVYDIRSGAEGQSRDGRPYREL